MGGTVIMMERFDAEDALKFIMDAIAKAGGFHQNASLDRIRVSRASGKTYTVNVFRFIQDGDLRFEGGHLQYFRALLLASREALIHRPVCQF